VEVAAGTAYYIKNLIKNREENELQQQPALSKYQKAIKNPSWIDWEASVASIA
jgi:hypothetical protein